MSIDFSNMTPKALQKLIADATREHKRKKKRAPLAQVRSKLVRMAKAEGYSIAELFGGSAPAAPAAAKTTRRKAGKTAKAGGTRKVAPKYRNPDNHLQTWTGRGKAPLWFNALIESGKTREDLLIAA